MCAFGYVKKVVVFSSIAGNRGTLWSFLIRRPSRKSDPGPYIADGSVCLTTTLARHLFYFKYNRLALDSDLLQMHKSLYSSKKADFTRIRTLVCCSNFRYLP